MVLSRKLKHFTRYSKLWCQQFARLVSSVEAFITSILYLDRKRRLEAPLCRPTHTHTHTRTHAHTHSQTHTHTHILPIAVEFGCGRYFLYSLPRNNVDGPPLNIAIKSQILLSCLRRRLCLRRCRVSRNPATVILRVVVESTVDLTMNFVLFVKVNCRRSKKNLTRELLPASSLSSSDGGDDDSVHIAVDIGVDVQ